MSTTCPKLCNKMQLEVVDFLIREVDITPATYWQKARLLIKKGIALRMCGVETLKDSIKYFSEAIEMIVSNPYISDFLLCVYLYGVGCANCVVTISRKIVWVVCVIQIKSTTC